MAQKPVNLNELQKQGRRLDSKELAALKPKDQVKYLLEVNKRQIADALPKVLTPERLTSVALQAMTSDKKLAECHTGTLISCIMKAATLGLEPNNALGHCYLIPFQNRKQQRTDCQIIIGFKGLLHLARRSGEIVSLSAHEVCELDEFDYEYGLNEKLSHKPAMGERGEVTHFYAVAHLKDGGYAFEVMSRGDVDRIMQGSQSKGEYGPWKDHYVAMGIKTCIRKLCKLLPMSVELAEATEIQAQNEKGEQDYGSFLEGEYETDEEVEPEPEPEPKKNPRKRGPAAKAAEAADKPKPVKDLLDQEPPFSDQIPAME